MLVMVMVIVHSYRDSHSDSQHDANNNNYNNDYDDHGNHNNHTKGAMGEYEGAMGEYGNSDDHGNDERESTHLSYVPST